jgi:hypothetical protein
MAQSARSRSLIALVIIFIFMAALLFPAPAYAAGPGHEPPPPKPPTNDLGKKDKPDKSPSHPAVDLPGDTSLVVTNNGTSLPLASLLSARAISANSPAKPVKFCKNSNPGFYGDCTAYASIQEAIDAVTSLRGNSSGVFYVAVDYPSSTVPPYLPAIELDQNKFYRPDGATQMSMLGGYVFSGAGAGTSSDKHPTQLVQPFTIQNINEDSSFTLSNFAFTISGYAAGTPDSYPPAVLHVLDSNHVSLENLTTTNTASGSALFISQSDDVSIADSTFKSYKGSSGGDNTLRAAITVYGVDSLAMDHVSASGNDLGDGILMMATDNILLNEVNAYSDFHGASIEDSHGGLTITDSHFDGSGDTGLVVENYFGTQAVQVNDSTFSGNGGGGFLANLFSTPDETDLSVFDSLGETVNTGNFITLDNVVADQNGDFGVDILISSQDTQPGLTVNISGGTTTTFNYGNFITLDEVEANHNGTYGIDATIYSQNPDISAPSSLARTTGPEALQTAAGASQQVDYQENAGNFITLNHITASNNASWGVSAVIVASGGSQNIIDVTNNLSFHNETGAHSDPRTLTSQVEVTSLVTFTSGNQINLSDVTADHNGLFGVDVNITSTEQRDNRITAGSKIDSTSGYSVDTGKASLVSSLDGSMQLTLISGNLINLDGVDASENASSFGVAATIVADANVNNLVSVLSLDGSETNYIGFDDVPAAMNTRLSLALQTDILSGDRINLNKVNTNENKEGLLAGIYSGASSSTWTKNTIDANLKSIITHFVWMEDGDATLDMAQDTKLKADIFSGAQINLDKVQSNDNLALGILAAIVTAGNVSNNLSADISMPFVTWNSFFLSQDSGKLITTWNNALDASIQSTNQINFQDVMVDRLSNPCNTDIPCEATAGIMASITSRGTTVNTLYPNLDNTFVNYTVMDEGKTALMSSKTHNALLAAIYSGNLIGLDEVDASRNAVSGIEATIESTSIITNNIVTDLNSYPSQNQYETGSTRSRSRIDASGNNHLQILLDSRNAIEMQDVDANHNLGVVGLAAAIKVSGGTTTNNLNGFLFDNTDDIAKIETGKSIFNTHNQANLDATIFNDDRIELDGIAASFNAGNGLSSWISAQDSRQNNVALTSELYTSSVTLVKDGVSTLVDIEDNHLSAYINTNNLITLNDVVASSNHQFGVEATIDSRISSNNHVVVDAIHYNGICNAGVEEGTPSNLCNVVTTASASLTDVSGITLKDVLATRNDQDDVNAQINSLNHETNYVGAHSYVLEVYEIEYETNNFVKNYHLYGHAEATIDSTNFIEMDNVATGPGGAWDVMAPASSNDIVSNLAETDEFMDILELITQSPYEETPDSLSRHYGKTEGIPGTAIGSDKPWQIINVYMDPGKNSGTLSCQFGTTLLFLEKMTAGDFEWGRVELAPCIVPSGTVATLAGLGQDALPGALPDGVIFQGKAFDFELSGAASLDGTMNLRFSLPAGFTLPSGQQLAILWFDPTARQWAELTTYAGGAYANAYTSNTGAFVLVLK